MPSKTSKSKTKLKSSEKLRLKSNFAVKKVFKPFYTGGSVGIDNNGDYVFTTCGDKVFAVNTASGLAEKSLSHDGDDITCFKISPNGSCIVTATRSLLLKQWKWPEVQCTRTWKAIHIAPVLTLCFDSTSTLLASGSSDGTVKVWDMVRQYCTHNFRGIPGVVSCLKFHPRDLKLYGAGNDYVIKVWDLNSSKCVGSMESHVSAVTVLEFPSENILVTAGRDSVINMWNLSESNCKTPVKTIPVYETIEDLICLPCEDISDNSVQATFDFLTFGSKGIVRKWQGSSGKCISAGSEGMQAEETYGYTYGKLMPCGQKIMAVTSDHNFNFISVDEHKTYKHFVGYNDEVLDVKFLGEGDLFLIVATNSPKIKVFEIETSACHLLKGHTDTVLSIDVFRNQSYFASCSKDQTVRLWKMNKNTNMFSCVAVGKGHTHTVESLACCKLKMSFMVSGSEDHTLKVWNIAKGENSHIDLSVHHTILAHNKDINSVAVSPNDKLIASGSQDKLAKLWTVEDGQNVGTLRGHKRGIWCVQFSPMDQVLASSSADGSIKLWSLSDFSCLKTLEGHDCSVLKLSFIVKGTQLVSCGSDGLLKLWTIKSSECNKTLDEHSDKIWTLTASQNSDAIVTGSADSTIVLWEDVTEKEKEEQYQKQEESVMQYQELQNLLQEKNYKQALTKAILLQHPFTALNVVREILWQPQGFEILNEIIGKLNLDKKHILLNFVMSWNTNSRNCHEAQAVLNVVLSTTHPSDIENMHDSQTIIEALLPYSERHYQRMSRIVQQSTFVDYTFQLMKLSVNE
uniref:Transducin beta-like protein 3 n=1 Tax=Phallusia mammillata TaxID=59560 RepID=A0A6F9DV53_9ASCI|nr:transducin beta-like protein 3 [Phallusia mammillata]